MTLADGPASAQVPSDAGETSSPLAQRIGLILAPVLFAGALAVPVEGLPASAQRTLAVTLLVATCWITQCIPIPVAALLPLPLLPLLGVAPSKEVVAAYADDNIFLFLGGFMVALAIEGCGLHRRVALGAIRAVGLSSRRLSLAFMLVGAFISLWMSNTAATLMLLPIALAVIRLVDESVDLGDARQAAAARRFGTLVLLSVAYGTSLGGLGTPIGTPPNAVFLGQVAARYPDRPDLHVSFVTWMVATIPLVAVSAPVAWLLMERLWLSTAGLQGAVSRLAGRDALRVGPWTRDEKVVAGVFLATALLWVFRRDIALGGVVVPGWADTLGLGKLVHDSTVALAAAILLFVLPSQERGRRLLDWRVEKRLPWGILLLFGGGFALAAQFETSGLSRWVGDAFSRHLPASAAARVALLAVVVIVMSEVANNTATAAVLLPVTSALADAGSLHPFTLMFPTVVAASFGFMLPVATAPNAIVFGTGRVPLLDMVRCGLLMDVLGVLLVTLASLLWWPLVL